MTEPSVPQGLKNQAEIAILPYVLYNCVIPAKNTRIRGETTMNKTELIGFGSFEVKERAARTGRNPRTKETVEIPASKAPVFKAGQAFKDAIR